MADTFGLKLGIEGEKDFKQALSDINKNFKVLGSEMKLVASQFEKNDNSIGALSSRNEVLNKQIDEQKNKIETLRAALKNASESFGENDKRTKNWQIQLNNAEAALNNMERELKDNTAQMNKTGTAADHMGDEIKQSGKQADDARSGFDNLKKTLSTVGAALGATIAAIGTAAVTAGKKIWDMANDTAEAGDEIDKQSQKLGISAENYQKLSYAMERSGADVEDFKKGTMNITKELANMQNGVDGAGEMFNQLGISVQNSDGSFKSTEDVLLSTIDALSNMEDETQRNSLANSVFGKSYQEILPLLNSGSDGIRQLMDEAEQYGMVMSDDAVKASAAFEDSLTKLKGTFNGVKNSIMSQLLPGLTAITDGFSELVSGNDEGADMIKSGIENVIETVTDMIPQVVSLLSVIGEAILEEAPSVLESLSSSIIDLLPGALDFALNDVLPNLVSSALSIAGQLLTSLSEALPDLMTSLAESLVTITTDLFSEENITGAVEMLLEFIQNVIAGIQDSLPILIEGVFQLVTGIVEALPDIVTMILEALPTIIDMIVDTITACLPVFIDGVVSLIDGIVQALPEIITAIIEALPDIIASILSATMNLLPVIIDGVIQLIAGLVKALPKLINSIIECLPDLIEMIGNTLIECLPELIEGNLKLILGLVEALPDLIVAILESLPDMINMFINSLLGCLPQLIKGVIQLVVGLVEHMPEIIKGLIDSVPTIIEKIVEAFKNGLGSIIDVGKSIVKGLWEGITGAASWLWDKITGWLRSIWDGIKNFFGIHSPSTKMRDMIGKNLVKGLAEGIVDEGKTAVNAMTALSKDLSAVTFSPITFKGITDDLSGAIPSDFDSQMRASVLTASQYDSGARVRSVSPTFNTNVTFGNVTINDGSDVEDIAHRVSDIITNDVMVKGGAFA